MIRKFISEVCRKQNRFDFFRSPGGGISIEAAVVVPLLIILICGIMQIGIVTIAYVNMQDAVRGIGREVSVRRIGVNAAASGGYSNSTGTTDYTGNCTTAQALSKPATSAPYIACSRVANLPGSYAVFVQEDDSGDTFLRLSVSMDSLLLFNIGFLGGGTTLTSEATYVLEDDG